MLMSPVLQIWEHTFYQKLNCTPVEHAILLTEICTNPRTNRQNTAQVSGSADEYRQSETGLTAGFLGPSGPDHVRDLPRSSSGPGHADRPLSVLHRACDGCGDGLRRGSDPNCVGPGRLSSVQLHLPFGPGW